MQKAEDPRQERAEQKGVGRGEKTEFHRQGESRNESNRGYCRLCLFAGVIRGRPSFWWDLVSEEALRAGD